MSGGFGDAPIVVRPVSRVVRSDEAELADEAERESVAEDLGYRPPPAAPPDPDGWRPLGGPASSSSA